MLHIYHIISYHIITYHSHNSVDDGTPIKQLRKRSSLDHRHRWFRVQCWFSPHLLRLLHCIFFPDHIRNNRSQVVAFIAFSFITACSKDFSSWRPTQKTWARTEWAGVMGWFWARERFLWGDFSPRWLPLLPCLPTTALLAPPTLHWPHRPPPRNPRVVAAVAAAAGSASSVDQSERSVTPPSTNEKGGG